MSFARVRLIHHALPISLLILRKNPTVLQSSEHCVLAKCAPYLLDMLEELFNPLTPGGGA